MKRVLIIMAAAGLLGGGIAHAGGGGYGCHTPKSTTGRGETISIGASCVTPTVLQVDPGARVRWITKDVYLHTITSGTGVWPEAELTVPDEITFEHTFHRAGLYPWYCRYHANMGGVIQVGDVGTLDAPSEPEPIASTGFGVVPSAGIATLLAGTVGFVAGRRRRIQD